MQCLELIGGRFGVHITLTSELSATPQEREKVVVIQTPYTMRTSWFKPICRLKVTHNFNIPPEHTQDKERVVFFRNYPKLCET